MYICVHIYIYIYIYQLYFVVGWSQWSSWGSCSATCGEGQHSRKRTCTEPEPANNGLECSGSTDDTSTCNIDPCPVNGMLFTTTYLYI